MTEDFGEWRFRSVSKVDYFLELEDCIRGVKLSLSHL